MATMESDSESQDSDDGRRFRFEATRKDATTISHSKYRDSSYSTRGQQSRSPGPSDRNRKDIEKFTNRCRDYRSRHSSRDRDSKDRRDRHSFQKYFKDSKDAHDSKHLKHRDDKDYKSSPVQRESDISESKDLRDTKDRKDSKSSRSNEKDSKNLRESRSSRDRSRKRSRDRSRSDRSSSDKHKLKYHEKHKSHSKDDQNKFKEERVLEKIDKHTKISLETKHIEDNLSKIVKDSTQDVCEFNALDFEIVSDLEEFSSDSSNCSHGNKSKTRKRHSKHSQLDGNSEGKRNRVEDLQKVNPRNGNHSATTSNNNPSAFSDFSLDSSSKKLKKDEKIANQLILETDSLRDSNYEKISKSNEREKSPKFIDDNNKGNDVVRENITKEKKIIGPVLPSSSYKSENLIEDDLSLKKWDKEPKNKMLQGEESLEESSQDDIIGPILPPHFLPQNESDEDVPSHFTKREKTCSKLKVYGPTMPSELNTDDVSAESDDDEVIGPLPVDHPHNKTSIVQQSLELRAKRIQYELMAEVFSIY